MVYEKMDPTESVILIQLDRLTQ